MISAVSDIETAVQAMKHGAYHFVTKDVDARPAALARPQRQRAAGPESPGAGALGAGRRRGGREFIVGPSRLTRDIVDLVHKIAKLSATVLILGESGTGKELLARLIHRESGDAATRRSSPSTSPRSRESSSRARCSATRRARSPARMRQQLGKFELAAGGTLFLDEIGDLRLDLQAKLLRAIQEGEIERVGGSKPIKTDFRLIAATNVDLEKAVKEGGSARTSTTASTSFPIKLPPLRERSEDIPELAEFFLQRYNTRFRKQIGGIADPTMAMLQKYWWPGNIRELENLIERLVAVTDKDWITDEDLPLEFHFAQLEPQGSRSGQPVRGRHQHVRAQLHPARAREVRLERHGDGRVPRHPAQHAEVQDGQARRAAARAPNARRLGLAGGERRQ